jgi:hypothetical protein
MSKYRPGSAGAAEEKMQKKGLIAFSIIMALIVLVWVIPSDHCSSVVGFANYYFVNAGAAWKIIGFISVAVFYWFLWNRFLAIENAAGSTIPAQTIILFGWMLLNIVLLSGFDFDLPSCAG